MQGALHRVIRIVASAGLVRAAVEDDFHHFRIVLHHDDVVVTAIAANGLRAPYSLCPAAGGELGKLRGMALTADVTAITRQIDARAQCTHQFDLAMLAVAAAARGIGTRRYDICVRDAVEGRKSATLDRDGARVLAWEIAADAVTTPGLYAGLPLSAGFTSWVAARLVGDAAEAALVLRRGIFISNGRGLAEWLEALPHAIASGGCWVQQEARHRLAIPNKGSTLDFTGRAEVLTGDDTDWLSGRTEAPAA